ncbi:MAG TPA: rhodanese-like domain-containing protein [Magnetospirillaceae bacterium]|nr:rhodanese-like domain-containing protein [Magnetospirillaceae bacterium]
MRALIAIGLTAAVLLAGCGPPASGERQTEIISAREALRLVEAGALLVDAQDSLRYGRAHAAGAVNISRSDIVVNYPFPGLVAPASHIEEIMGSRGIGPETLVVVYDTNQNMDAARLWWTLKYYGHDAVKVVSGGLDALEAAGAEISTDPVEPKPAVFRASTPRAEMVLNLAEVLAQVENPDPRTVLVDVRSTGEFAEGTIPGSILMDFAGNNFADDTFRPIQHIRIRHLEKGIDYDDRVILFCQTSIRAAHTYLVLYNSGYRDLALYDGAWVEWSSDPARPVQTPAEAVIRVPAADKS